MLDAMSTSGVGTAVGTFSAFTSIALSSSEYFGGHKPVLKEVLKSVVIVSIACHLMGLGHP